MKTHLIDVLKTRLEDTKHTPCGRISHILISELERQVKKRT